MIVQLIDAKLSSAIDKIDVHDVVCSNKMCIAIHHCLSQNYWCWRGRKFSIQFGRVGKNYVHVLGNSVKTFIMKHGNISLLIVFSDGVVTDIVVFWVPFS